MRFKADVDPGGIRPEIILALMVAERIWAQQGAEVVVTSMLEGRHSPTSLHYSGQAVDIRRWNLRDPEAAVQALREALPANQYDVILEKDHIHVEWQPKRPVA